MSTFNRRALVAGATLAASAALRACSTPAVAASSPDAELIRLGIEFGRAHAHWLACWQEWDRTEREWGASLDAMGISYAKQGEAILSVRAECGVDAASDANDAALDAVDALSEQIQAIRATTVAGFAVKAKVACHHAISAREFVKPASRRNHDSNMLLSFLNEIETAAEASQ
jgi:hypothetical protein